MAKIKNMKVTHPPLRSSLKASVLSKVACVYDLRLKKVNKKKSWRPRAKVRWDCLTNQSCLGLQGQDSWGWRTTEVANKLPAVSITVPWDKSYMTRHRWLKGEGWLVQHTQGKCQRLSQTFVKQNLITSHRTKRQVRKKTRKQSVHLHTPMHI